MKTDVYDGGGGSRSGALNEAEIEVIDRAMDHLNERKRTYEEQFGPYNDDDYRDPAQCPESRRALVAEIKVCAASIPVARHLASYACGNYPLPFTEDLEGLYHRIMAWDPHLPRQSHPTTT